MKLMPLFDKEISKKRMYLVTTICCLLYMILAVLLAILSKGSGSDNFQANLAVSRGIITQIQMMITVYMVLVLRKEGYITAVILNIIGFLAAFRYILISSSAASAPGLISYAAVIIILTLIMKYKEQANDYVNQIENQKILLKNSEKKLYEQAHRDFLTKLPNRDFYLQCLERELENARNYGNGFGVVFMDLDSFKSINDEFGHLAGDEVLIEVARRLTEILDQSMIAARSGGDEFFLLVRDVADISDIEKTLDIIMKALKEPFFVNGVKLLLSACAGIAVYPDDGDNSSELIKNADIAMYQAKSKGISQYLFCSESMKKEASKKTLLINSLYNALEREEFFLHYQPQIHAETGAVIGFEALLRWNHPDFGLIPPGTFIPLAEQSGLIKPIGLWVFQTVCKEYRDYFSDIRISINFSMEQLKDADIIEDLTGIIQETGIDPQRLLIEITESESFNSDVEIIEKLTRLKELGLLIAIDDFGREYSALNRIRSFPVDLLKIDMEYIHGLSSGNSKDKAIVKTIIQLAKNLGIRILAEGVETKEQYEFLKSEKCDEIQGFYFYKGMPVSEVRKLLGSSNSDISELQGGRKLQRSVTQTPRGSNSPSPP